MIQFYSIKIQAVDWETTFCPWSSVFSDSTVIPEAAAGTGSFLLLTCFLGCQKQNKYHQTDTHASTHALVLQPLKLLKPGSQNKMRLKIKAKGGRYLL